MLRSNVGRVCYMAMAVGLAGMGTSVFAQGVDATARSPQPATTGDDGLGEIIVTARRVAENIQRVPVAVTAVTAQGLIDRGIRNVQDLTSVAPGVIVRSGLGNASIATPSIRGQNQTNTDANIDPAAAVYIDGAYVARPYGGNSGLADIARVELLRGPQGTLFGRNTPGGAISITTADPELDRIGGVLRAGVGNYGRHNFEATLNIPLGDRLGLRAAVRTANDNGYARNDFNGFRLSNEDTLNARIKLLAKPTDRLTMIFAAERFHLDQSGGAVRLATFTPGGALQTYLAGQYGVDVATLVNTNGFLHAKLDTEPHTRVSVWSATQTTSWDAGFAAVKAIFNYRDLNGYSLLDLDGTPYLVQSTRTSNRFQQYSGELQINGKAIGDKLDYTGGLFYYRETGIDSSVGVTRPLTTATTPTLTRSRQNTRSYAAFFQGSYHFTDAFAATGGLRYTIDNKRPEAQSRQAVGKPAESCSVAAALLPDPSVCVAPFHRRDRKVTYDASLEYTPNPTVLAYAKVARGFRSGGFNARASGTNVFAYAAFEPETVDSYEIGLKSDLFGGRLRLNLAAYHERLKNLQRNSTTIAPNGSTTNRVSNAQGKVDGIEAEATLRLFEGFVVGANASYTNARYTSFIDVLPTGTLDRTNEPFALVPKYTATLNASYRRDVGIGEMLLRADLNHTDDLYFQTSAIRTGTDGFVRQKAFNLINARAALKMDGGFEVAVYSTNLTNKITKVGTVDLSTHIITQYSDPRRIGLEISKTF